MDKRLEVADQQILAAIESLTVSIGQRIAEKGRRGFISSHEALGAICEEYHELVDAIKSNNTVEIANELRDVAVGCIYAIASMLEYEEHLKAAKEKLKENISDSE